MGQPEHRGHGAAWAQMAMAITGVRIGFKDGAVRWGLYGGPAVRKARKPVWEALRDTRDAEQGEGQTMRTDQDTRHMSSPSSLPRTGWTR